MSKQLALVIDLNVCVGCHACVTSCKEWNTSGSAGSMPDEQPYGSDPSGTFFNRVQTYEVGKFPDCETVHFPKSCLHCEDPPCVPVCPTGASYKREEDGIVLINQDTCIGCKRCIQACPYGAPQFNSSTSLVEKCTFCVHRLYDSSGARTGFQPACVTTCVGNALHLVEDFDLAESGENAPDGFADKSLTVPSVKFATGPA